MKGIIKLAPIDNPVEGMKVINGKWVNEIAELNEKKDWCSIRAGGTITQNKPIIELQQLVVEYIHTDEYGQGADWREVLTTKTLPLHPDDWQKGLELIGKEVEFEIIDFRTIDWMNNK